MKQNIYDYPKSHKTPMPDEKRTLPEGQEDNTLDGKEFQNWTIRAKKLARCGVEQEKTVQSQRYGDVVNKCDI